MSEWTEADLELLDQTVNRAVESAVGDDVTAALDELGWRELVSEPMSLPTRRVVRAATTAHGRHLRTSTLLHSWAAWALVEQGLVDPAMAPRLAMAIPMSRDPQVAVILPGAPSGHVVTRMGDSTLVTLSAAGAEKLPTLEPALGLATVAIDGAAVEVATGERGRSSWAMVEAMVRAALAQEITGAARGAIDIAVTHVSTRHQFGRPLGAFQAVQHQLAEAFVWMTSLDEVCRCVFSGDTPCVDAVTGGYLDRLARRTVDVVNAATQQVTGAMGYTTEFPLHRYLERTLVLSGLLNALDFVDRPRLETSDELWAMLDLVEA